MNTKEKPKIFANIFLLSLKNPDVIKKFNKMKENSIIKYHKVINTVLLIINLMTIGMNFMIQNYSSVNVPSFNMITSYVTSAFSFTIIIMNVLSKKIKILTVTNYINFIIFLFTCFNIKVALMITTSSDPSMASFLVLTETTLRLVMIWISLTSYIENLILNLVSVALMWSVIYPNINEEVLKSTVYFFSVYTLMFIILTFFSYFFERLQKDNFNSKYTAGNKLRCLTDVYENIESGFLLLRSGRISYVNTFLRNNLHKIVESKPSEEVHLNSKENASLQIKKNSNDERDPNNLLYVLFLKLEINSISDPIVKETISNLILEIKKNKNENMIDLVVRYVSDLKGVDSFLMIGDFSIDKDGNESHFDIFCRYNRSNYYGDQLTFLFNDVTKTKMREKQNAEFKYKSLFLSKVAHEFKNPLICITELVNQLSDQRSKGNDGRATIIQIKAMSNFLLVLVKDLNHFSQSQIGKEMEIENKETNMDELLSFCKEIIESLLIKTNKSQVVSLKINKNIREVNLILDEWRIKQILLNLLSNAVKFTNFGEVTLNVDILTKEEGDFIRFEVVDSGMGIKEENKSKLFTPFRKGSNNKGNEFGSGLGLNIVCDICQKLGSQLNFESVYEKGSIFWFELPLHLCEDNSLVSSSDSSLDESKNDKIINANSILRGGNNSVATKIFTNKFVEFRPLLPRKFDSGKSIVICILIINLVDLENNVNVVEMNVIEKKEKKRFNKFKFSEIINSPENITFLKLGDNDSEYDNKFLNVIVADDESFIRMASTRVLQMVSDELKINVNVIEADDGIELLYIFYKCFLLGIKISIIFSDESMTFLKGSRTATLVKEFAEIKSFTNNYKFYLVTAYDTETMSSMIDSSVTDVISKPLEKRVAMRILKEISRDQ